MNKITSIIFLFLFIQVFQSCDKVVIGELINDSDEQIEFYFSGVELEFNTGNAVLSKTEKGRFYYTLGAGTSEFLFEGINADFIDAILTDTLGIITSTDTIVLESKQDIMDAFERIDGDTYELVIE